MNDHSHSSAHYSLSDGSARNSSSAVNLRYLTGDTSSGSQIAGALRCSLTLLGLLLIGLLVLVQDASADEEVIIVNPGVPYRDLSANALRAIFGMRLRTWPNGNRITVFVLNDQSPVHASFVKQTLSIFPHQLRLAWDRLVYSGTGQAPLEVSSEMEMLANVASTANAIGYLERKMVNDSVRVVDIR